MGAAKAALEVLCRYFAVALAPRQITVNTVSPGWTDDSVLNTLPEAVQNTIRNWQQAGWTPVRRLGLPADLGNAVTLLCSAEANGRWASMSDAPPSTSRTCPVIQLASAEQSSVTAFPRSAGRPSLRTGVQPACCQLRMVFCTASGRVLRTLSSVQPGLTVLTVICRGARATAK